MTDPDRAARDSALNDAEFPDDERGLTGTTDADTSGTDPAGQTARDVSYEDDGVPDIADDDHPTESLAEDPEFAPVPGERPGASTDFGTTAREQAEGESLSGRLDREVPDTGLDPTDDVRAAETHDRTVPSSARTASTTRPTPSPTASATTSSPAPRTRPVARAPRSGRCTSPTADPPSTRGRDTRCVAAPSAPRGLSGALIRARLG